MIIVDLVLHFPNGYRVTCVHLIEEREHLVHTSNIQKRHTLDAFTGSAARGPVRSGCISRTALDKDTAWFTDSEIDDGASASSPETPKQESTVLVVGGCVLAGIL